MIDYIIVGSGLAGISFAEIAFLHDKVLLFLIITHKIHQR